MTGMASPEKASGQVKKKSERKGATKEEYRQLSSIMGVMNNLRKQVSGREKTLNHRLRVCDCDRTGHLLYMTALLCTTLS